MAIYILLQRLMLLDPGSIQSHPDMGVGIITKWRYSYYENIDLLQSEIQTQIEKYLPQLQGVNVKIARADHHDIIISIEVNNKLYVFELHEDKLQLKQL